MKRVHELAKELDLSTSALISLLKKIGFRTKGHMGIIPDELVEKCKKEIERSKLNLKIKDKERKQIMAKIKKGLPPRKEETPEEKKLKIEKRVRETISKIELGDRRKKYYKPVKEEEKIEEEKKLKLKPLTSVRELSSLLKVDPLDLISHFLELGMAVTINQRLDFETASTICAEYGYDTELASAYEEKEEKIETEKLVERPPIVTVMGHVDHGKTTLLDFIRKTNIAEKEVGRITQHIGGYKVKYNNKYITFIDTPGHEAFTAMRARGAKVTDIAVIVIAADEGVMPQTIEAINHVRDANVPMIIAINKIDLPTADPEKVLRDLLNYNVVTEAHKGEVLYCKVSAKTGVGVDTLLENILLQAELLELKCSKETPAKGVIIETKLDKGKGPMATVIITNGTLRIGDYFVAGKTSGKVRMLLDENGNFKNKAEPSDPVQVVGFESLPECGDSFKSIKDERTAKEIAMMRKLETKEIGKKEISLESLQKELKEKKELKLIIKADTAGSAEALSDSLERLSTLTLNGQNSVEEDIRVKVIHRGIGEITPSDVLLASASSAIIIGFHTAENHEAEILSKEKGVEIRKYNIIYDAIEEIKLALKNMLPPKLEKYLIGIAEIRKIFKIKSVGLVAGCYVKEGKIVREGVVKIKRGGEIIHEGKIEDLKHFKDSVKEVEKGNECGISFKEPVKILEGDIIEEWGIREIPR